MNLLVFRWKCTTRERRRRFMDSWAEATKKCKCETESHERICGPCVCARPIQCLWWNATEMDAYCIRRLHGSDASNLIATRVNSIFDRMTLGYSHFPGIVGLTQLAFRNTTLCCCCWLAHRKSYVRQKRLRWIGSCAIRSQQQAMYTHTTDMPKIYNVYIPRDSCSDALFFDVSISLRG